MVTGRVVELTQEGVKASSLTSKKPPILGAAVPRSNPLRTAVHTFSDLE